MSHYCFRPLIEQLEKSEDVIALDLPGFGESDRPPLDAFSYAFTAMSEVVEAVLDRLEVPRAIFLGHSLGAGVAMTLAAQRPARVEKLIVVSGSLYQLAWPAPIRPLMMPAIGPFLFRNAFTKWQLKQKLRADFPRAPELVDDEFVDYYWERLHRAGGPEAAYAVFLTIAAQSDNNADPGRIRCKTLLLWGEEDRLVPLHHGKRLSRAIAGAELKVVPATGHFSYIERTEEFMRLLSPFLQTDASAVTITPVPSRHAG